MEGDSKWAEKKRGGILRDLKGAPLNNPLSGRIQASPLLYGGPTAKPLFGANPLKHKKHHHKKRFEVGNIPDLVSNDDISAGEEGPTPRAADLVAPKLGELKGVPPKYASPDPVDPPSLPKLARDYNDVMRKVRETKKLPHEQQRDVSPRRARGNSAGSQSSRHYAHTPQPQFVGDGRYTDEGAYVTQPQSALLPSDKDRGDREVTSDSEYNTLAEPETDAAPPLPTGRRKGRIRVALRKRPLRDNEEGEDCVSVADHKVHIGAIKQRVDLSEYTEKHDYEFDNAFGEDSTNVDVYRSCGKSLIDTVFEGGAASCFAYGQTGSGKTHTMIGSEKEEGLYILAATDIFERLQPEHHVFVSLYEIYCNSLFDLLNYRTVVVAREDANKRVNICGLTWHEISSVEDLRSIIDKGTVQRRTGSTSANEFSSRSHAVMTITLRDELHPKFCGSLNVVDLAGSERAADTAANDKQTRLEGAEINKSLLALKECIRGLDERKRHIPFRGSKLTEVLRDSFVGNSRTVMVATISPTSDSVEHTLNTLRYAFRVKGLTVAQVDPSKERNAPRPVPIAMPRSKSVDRDVPAVPLLPPIREKRKKKSREKKRSASSTPRIQAEQFCALETGLKSEIQTLRQEMQEISKVKDDHITTLVEQNRRLERQLRKMQKMLLNAQPVSVVELDSDRLSDDGDCAAISD